MGALNAPRGDDGIVQIPHIQNTAVIQIIQVERIGAIFRNLQIALIAGAPEQTLHDGNG
jgi:hypothetical protein